MIKDRYIYWKLGLIFIIGLALVCLFKVYQNIFDIKLISALIISYIIFIVGLFYDKKITFIGYLFALYIILFYREKTDNNISDTDYINKWIDLLFSNKIVFINVFGNLVLYIPFVYFLKGFIKKTLLSIIIVFGFIVIGEYVQYLLKIGVFDLVDIAINTLGVLMFGLVLEVSVWMKKIKMN